MTGDNGYGTCRHGWPDPTLCPICQSNPATPPVTVYFTAGGQHFHSTHRCTALAEGQRIVAERGGVPAPIETGYLDIVAMKRKPCRTCTA
jgi:hypothetical protein